MALSVIFIFVSAFICLVLPTLIAAIMMIKRRGHWTMFLLGIVSFTVSQLLIRLPLLGELQNTAWFTMFTLTQPLLYFLLLALSAGLFEETGRFAAMRFLNKGLLTWENGVLFGLGHGGIEALWIVGIPYIKQITGMYSEGGAAAFGVYPPDVFLAPGVERLLTLMLHIGFTMLVLYAVRRRNIWFFIMAILAHALVDAVLPLLSIAGVKLTGPEAVWIIEGAIAVFAAIALWVTLRMRSVFKKLNGGIV